MICYRGKVFIFAVLSFLCTQCVSTDETKQVTDTEATLTFDRKCISDCDCHYKNAKARGQVYLTCKQGKCQCRNPSIPVQDAPTYPVRALNDDCVVRFNAPCGTTDGITIVCEKGKTCVEGRCRSQIRSRTKYVFCDEDIDCEEGLKCIEKKVPPIVSYCQEAPPATLTFERECTNYNDCHYSNTEVHDQVFLTCNEGKCQCQDPDSLYWPQDVPIYPVRILNDVCVAKYNAPCGTRDGITIACEESKICIEGRCRSEIRSRTKDFYCDEDIDCQEGLRCIIQLDSFPIASLCKESRQKFERKCTYDHDCHFKNGKVRDQVYLTCKQGKCQCRNSPSPVQDRPIYGVALTIDDCMVFSTSPCGTIDGITLACEEGKSCIEGRCRSQIRSGTKDSYCDEDIDCQDGLKCVEREEKRFPVCEEA
ncbi:hypothetical protein HA402_006046 [Bradysia odoriphaga]|nr:hypothetical protein HA402_006046 [Bradysia odoriphaga]